MHRNTVHRIVKNFPNSIWKLHYILHAFKCTYRYVYVRHLVIFFVKKTGNYDVTSYRPQKKHCQQLYFFNILTGITVDSFNCCNDKRHYGNVKKSFDPKRVSKRYCYCNIYR